MKNIKVLTLAILVSAVSFNCSNDDDATAPSTPTPTTISFSGTYSQDDQMGRPAVNTVFVSAASKNQFNTTIPTGQNAAFQSMFETNLTGLSPAYANAGDANALGQDAAAFTGLLATDVLNVSLDEPTSFYNGTQLLTGRALTDDVITVELILIFGGEDALGGVSGTATSENPGLSDDNVSSNDKAFLTSFPYLASAH
ncbi:DUF4331 family protein [Lacinutrix mariniflava]|uniref:DUF4331 family protein n=1 Tax=Lacinutrix mariniflava TaxID=342955 RepID=UPI0006E251C2|nr:DUF4331 family protein [Lacinutrix mariniflava]